MSSLTAIFGSSDEKHQDSEKLLNLYWNRAELKKEFAGMRKEQFRLQDRIKQQEGSNARLQQKLEHLEDLLLDPAWVHNVAVFYQLRALSLRCERKLARFAEQLKQQREQKQHNLILVKWNEQRSQEARSVERELVLKRDAVHTLEDQLQAERHRLMNMSGFLKVFRRRSVTAILDNLAARIDEAQQEAESLAGQLDEVKGRRPPDNAGLDVRTKRTINLMILSFAQQLYTHFGDDELAAMVRESGQKSVGAINYGNRQECSALLDRIALCAEKLDQAADLADVLQKRAKLIGESALFKDDTEAVPASGSVQTLFSINRNGQVRQAELDLIGQNYWGVAKVLSR